MARVTEEDPVPQEPRSQEVVGRSPAVELPAGESRAGEPLSSDSFLIDGRRTRGYRLARWIVRRAVALLFWPTMTGLENVPASGAVIIAPVHRSFADFAFTGSITGRKIFFMTKEEMWKFPPLGKLLLALGAFPVNRAGTDREALRRAETVLLRGQVLVLFPEGMRQSGSAVGDLHEGAAFLSARTGAPVVPVGIGGSDKAMPKGRALPRPMRCRVVVGRALEAPSGPAGRVPRRRIHEASLELRRAIQEVYDEARAGY